MSDIFLSYARSDRDRAQIFAEILEQQGYSVWWDPKTPPGKTWDKVIKEALNSAKCVIVLWSHASVLSDWVKEEAENGKKRRILIPVLIDDVDIPLGFGRIQTARLIDWRGTLSHPEFSLILNSVAEIVGRTPAQKMEIKDRINNTIREREGKKPRQEEQERTARKREELTLKKPRGTSWKGVFTLALVLSVLLGYWIIAPGANNAPETSKFPQTTAIPTSTPTPIPTLTPIPTPTLIPTPAPGQKVFTNSISMDFLLIPAGEFDMGSSTGDNDERPVHRVKIAKAFYIGKFEVTQKQWHDVVGNYPSYFTGNDLPVENVSWNDVQEFIKKLNEKEGTDKYRLPSEAEWEYAARAGTTTRYSFGDDESELGDYAWYAENSGSRPPKNGDYYGYDKDDLLNNWWNGKTHPIGEKMPNPWGLYDMHGNVLEWVEDIYHDSYYGSPNDGSAWEEDGSFRVARGSAWYYSAGFLRSTNRYYDTPTRRRPVLGFRLLLSP